MKKTKVVSLSLSKEIWDDIDEQRKDISRSKYVQRILENARVGVASK